MLCRKQGTTMIDKKIFSEQFEPKEQFMLFMKLIGLCYKSLVNYATDIFRCSAIIHEELDKDGYTSLYDIREQDEIRSYQQLLENNTQFIIQNRKETAVCQQVFTTM